MVGSVMVYELGYCIPQKPDLRQYSGLQYYIYQCSDQPTDTVYQLNIRSNIMLANMMKVHANRNGVMSEAFCGCGPRLGRRGGLANALTLGGAR